MIYTSLNALLGPWVCTKSVKRSVWDVFGGSSEASWALLRSLGRTFGVPWVSLVAFGVVLVGLVGSWGGAKLQNIHICEAKTHPVTKSRIARMHQGCTKDAPGMLRGCTKDAPNGKYGGACKGQRGAFS